MTGIAGGLGGHDILLSVKRSQLTSRVDVVVLVSQLRAVFRAQDEGKTMLIKLSNTNLRVADPSQDLRGHRVVDKDDRDPR